MPTPVGPAPRDPDDPDLWDWDDPWNEDQDDSPRQLSTSRRWLQIGAVALVVVALVLLVVISVL